ncbi:FAD-dependent thymidylate synthase [Candidatus Oleimmundimicrobium sp.]|uniref:FAD-dependent thymidylate synthase n=1 Tax=Candidatus Oleimmundimicrobium sp. TaxID=3060597 RepID=UPI002728A3ED|nr:FAD-dependent thymidylate synthase [Candidatus Oleimmundimicrobium sp.]MDO8886091.1 FAD-dependent thymidylate synthase [Candidatus Oleimmundimicrobium sp.]
MNVKLLEHTPKPERTIATAARICYAPVGADELFRVLSDKEVEKLVNLIIKSGHLSAVEHAVFTFAIDGISRVCSHQLVRHRLASFNQQSQRYVKYSSDLKFITPSSIENNPLAKEKFDKLNATALKVYQELLEEGIEAEDARYILPNSTETKMVVTMNAREFLHFLSLRCCNRAQWEIKELALTMLKEAKEVAPLLFKEAGPPCNRGPCPEGKFSCGKPWKKIK